MMGHRSYISEWSCSDPASDWKSFIPSSQKFIYRNKDSNANAIPKEFTYPHGQILQHREKQMKETKKLRIYANSYLDRRPSSTTHPGETLVRDQNNCHDSTASWPSKDGRAPKCALCLNHGTKVLVKNHKRYCPWRECRCYKCKLTNDRRHIMASQIALRRAQVQDEEKVRKFPNSHSKSFQSHLNCSQGRIQIDHSSNTKLEGDCWSLPDSKSPSLSADVGSICDDSPKLEDEGKTTFKSGGNENTWRIFGYGESRTNLSSSVFRESCPSVVEPMMAKSHGANQESLLKSSCSSYSASDGPMKFSFPSITLMSPFYAATASPSHGFHKMSSHFDLQPTKTVTTIDEMKTSVKSLMELFHLPPETEWLIYKVLKDNRGDFKQASLKFFEAQCELRSWELLREAAGNVSFTWSDS